ncbi:hypothetical protein [Streptomyces sp. 13-12-16]|uniref:hypothetical protein n=1 Tax=Streptomyces sp. 13-12-16 TaxID=1570823 RepID=UPI00117C9B38|nr:hypothetical protein [Streptomyces sp. 13-12-16]
MISKVTPRELTLFRRRSDAFFKDPEAELNAARKSLRARPKEELLAWGTAETVVALTPFALAVVQGVLTSLTESLVASATDRGREAAARLLRLMLRRASAGETAPDVHGAASTEEEHLSAEQLGLVHAHARELALSQGLDEASALRLADALVAELGP